MSGSLDDLYRNLDKWFEYSKQFDHTDEKKTVIEETGRSEQVSSPQKTQETARLAVLPSVTPSAIHSQPLQAYPSTLDLEEDKALKTTRLRRKAEAPVEKETRDQLLERLLDPVLTLEEAAQVLNVCPTTVRRYTNKGLLKHYRTTGNQRRFRLSQVLSFMEALGVSPNTGTLELQASPPGPERDHERSIHHGNDNHAGTNSVAG